LIKEVKRIWANPTAGKGVLLVNRDVDNTAEKRRQFRPVALTALTIALRDVR
jgi:hypothetical protein